MHLFDAMVSSGPETRLLPVNEPTPFEQGLLVHRTVIAAAQISPWLSSYANLPLVS